MIYFLASIVDLYSFSVYSPYEIIHLITELHYPFIFHVKVFSIYLSIRVKYNLYCNATNSGNDSFKLYFPYEDIKLCLLSI